MFVRPSAGPVSRAGAYGIRRLPNEPPTKHSGIDFVGRTGSPVRAVRSGTVIVSAPNGTYQSYGNLVVIKHDDPTGAPYSLYAHMNKLRVRRGQRVRAGQIVGGMGNTSARRGDPGHTVRTHLHFEMLKRFPAPPDVGRVDPTPFLRGDKPRAPVYASTPVMYPELTWGHGPLLYSQATPFAGVFVDGGGDGVIWVVGLAALA